MPTTRSQVSKSDNSEATLKKTASGAKKRKATDSSTAGQVKKQKQPSASSQPEPREREDKTTGDGSADADAVTINRAPVLELWSASVAQFLHPSVPWRTCLSVGGAISAITAISKGRAIGKMDKPGPESAEEKNQKRRAEQKDLDVLQVMGFQLSLQDGNAMVGGKSKKGNEDVLMKKYGSQNYDRVKEVFATSLDTWKGHEDELEKGAFNMYEDFRPSVAAGQKGWGRKGELSLEKIESVVRKSG